MSFGWRPSARDQLVQRARNMVHEAIEAGLLAPANTLLCADCGNAASCYDHRDYHAPLLVEAVCQPCNIRRGPGFPAIGEDDGKEYNKNPRGKIIGHGWNPLEAGDGYSPTECVVRGDIDWHRIEGDRGLLWYGMQSLDYAIAVLSRSRGRSDHLRYEYFKARDPWA